MTLITFGKDERYKDQKAWAEETCKLFLNSTIWRLHMSKTKIEVLQRENKWLHDALQKNQVRAAQQDETIKMLKRRIEIMEAYNDINE